MLCDYGTVAGMLRGRGSPTSQEHGSTASPPNAAPLRFDMPTSHNPISAYSPDYAPEPVLANSPRLDRLVREGKLYLSLKDAIDLALENNVNLPIARYNLPIANTDILRTQAGRFFRALNSRVTQRP